MRGLTMIFLTCLTLLSYAGDDASYSWMQGKEKVGTLELSFDVDGRSTTYTYDSHIQVDVGVEMDVREQWKSVYTEDVGLVLVEIKNILNGRPRVSITETADDKQVLRVINGKSKTADRQTDVVGYMLLFFEMPEDIHAVYSEVYGLEFTVRQNGDRSLIVTDSRNRRHKFNYDEDGLLEKAQVEMTMGGFDLVRD